MRRKFGWLVLGACVLLGCNSEDASVGTSTAGGGGTGGGGTGGGGTGGGGAGDVAPAFPAEWAKGFGVPGDPQSPVAVIVDASGHVALGGQLDGDIHFGDQPLYPYNESDTDLYLARFDAAGVIDQSQRLGVPDSSEYLTAMAAAGENMVLAGSYDEGTNLGCGDLPGGSSFSGFVTLLSAAGECVWSRGFGDGQAEVKARHVAVDAEQNVYVTGSLEGTADFGGGAYTSQGGQDVFVAKLGGDGTHLWSHRFGDDHYFQEGVRVAVNGLGQVVVAGQFDDALDLSGGVAPLESQSIGDVFVAALDGATGAHAWSQRFVETGVADLHALAVDPSSNIVIAGVFSGRMKFGSEVGISEDAFDGFVAKLDSAGNALWSRFFIGPDKQYVGGVAFDEQGDVLLSGYFKGGIDLGGAPLVAASTCAEAELCFDGFVAELASGDGSLLRSMRLGAGGNDLVWNMAARKSGGPVIMGVYGETIDIGGISTQPGSVFLAQLR